MSKSVVIWGVNKATGQAMDVPEHVLVVMRRAEEFLNAQLKPLEHLSVKGTWGNYEWSHETSWQVTLTIFTSDCSLARKIPIREFYVPLAIKDFILDALLDFTKLVSANVGESIRQIRSDLKQMLAS